MNLAVIPFPFHAHRSSPSQMNSRTAEIPAPSQMRGDAGTAGQKAADGSAPLVKGRKFVVFVAGGSAYALDSQTVSEVVRDLVPARIPNTPQWLLGAANLRGEILTVVALDRLLGSESERDRQTPKHIVVRLEAMDALLAFRVEKLREIVTVANSAIVPGSQDERPFVSGAFEHKGETFTVVNVVELVESLRLN